MPDFDNFLGTLKNNQMRYGRETIVHCANCGAPNPSVAIVCSNCGNAVSKQLFGRGFTVNKDAFEQDEIPPVPQPPYTGQITQNPYEYPSNPYYQDPYRGYDNYNNYNNMDINIPTMSPPMPPPVSNFAPAPPQYAQQPSYQMPPQPSQQPSPQPPQQPSQIYKRTDTQRQYDVVIPESNSSWSNQEQQRENEYASQPKYKANRISVPKPFDDPAEYEKNTPELYTNQEPSSEQAEDFESNTKNEQDNNPNSYHEQLRQYKEQLSTTFDSSDNDDGAVKNKDKPSESYTIEPDLPEDTSKSQKNAPHPEPSEKLSDSQEMPDILPEPESEPEPEPVLTWKNIPIKGNHNRKDNHTAPERPNLYKQNQGHSIDNNSVKLDADFDPLKTNAQNNTFVSSEDTQSSVNANDQIGHSNNTDHARQNSYGQFPFYADSDNTDDADGSLQPWKLYQKQMMSMYEAMANMQPIVFPSQMQTNENTQSSPNMYAQPVPFQPGLMPAGVPIPMYVMFNPNGGMTMYLNPISLPPMLPQASDNIPEQPVAVAETPHSSKAEVDDTLKKIRSHERFDGRYLAYMDFSGDKYLRWEHIRYADNIVGIKYPADFDIENADFSDRDISFSDFSNLPLLKWKQLKNAASLKGIIYPNDFNIDRVDFFGRDISQSDFSNLHSLRWKHIASAQKIKGIVYPESFDIENADFSDRDISFSDFTRVENLRWKNIRDASSIRGIEYPADFNIDRADFNGRDISFSDFTLLPGLRWRQISVASKIYGIAYPESFDINNAVFAGRNISYSDFSRVHQLSFFSIRDARNISGIIYPSSFNMQRSDFRGRDISYSDFSLVKNMRFSHIADASNLKGIIYPPSFDLENADFRGFDLTDSDFSLLPRYKKVYLDSAIGENITLPSTGSDARGRTSRL